MACPTLIDPGCLVSSIPQQAASAVADGVIGQIAAAIQSGVAWIVTNTVGWWVKVPSPDLTAEPAVGQLQQWMLPIAAAVAVLGMAIAGAKMTFSRKANPLIDAGSGLAIIAATSALGVVLPSMLLRAGDAWSQWVLNASSGGRFGERMTVMLTLAGSAPGVVIVLGIIAIVMATVQAVLMLFRQASLVILAGVLPLAAAGTLTPATRAWFRRVTGWMLALIFYKPAAAAVYATAFTLIGAGTDPRTLLMGFAMVLLSLLALPALMRFFSWTTGAVADSAHGGGFFQTVVGGAIAVGALRSSSGGSGGLGAVEQARLTADQLGPLTDAPQGAAGHGTGHPAASAHYRTAGHEAGGGTQAGAAAGAPSGAGAPGRTGSARAAGRPVSGTVGAPRSPARPEQPPEGA